MHVCAEVKAYLVKRLEECRARSTDEAGPLKNNGEEYG
ncbi:MAG: hypothetical protein QOK44_5174 [Betaproteobacteria bacterium]|nr:hypothetical protein [Betaproteobacteria bacterium]